LNPLQLNSGVREHTSISVIHLIGPGGAGKSTVAPVVAELLGGVAGDLDRMFDAAHGNIDSYIQVHGYAAYARTNIQTYCAYRPRTQAVIALSSGFMTYPATVHPAAADLQRQLAVAATTVLLLPSLNREICVAETLRRQQARPLAIRRSPEREEVVIRERFAVYQRLSTPVVTTMQPVEAVAREIIRCVAQRTGDLGSAPLLSNER
jgi:shikimate kinase